MNMKMYCIRVPGELLAAVDLIAAERAYDSRSDCIRAMIAEGPQARGIDWHNWKEPDPRQLNLSTDDPNE